MSFGSGRTQKPEKAAAVSMPGSISSVRAINTVLALEPRIAFDGAMVDTAEQVVSCDGFDNASQASSVESVACYVNLVEPMAEACFASPRTEIVFVDTSVPDAATLLAGIRPGVEVVLIDSTRDGIAQIADALAHRSSVDTIHLISHGTEGTLKLAGGDVTAETITGKHAADLARISQALSANADFLVYGCDFASGEAGRIAAQLLSEKTGADVAASDDKTGHETLGGDWELEYDTGRIDANTVITAQLAGEYVQLLAPPVVDLNGATAGTNVAVTFTENQILGATGVNSNQASVLTLAPAATVTGGGTIRSIEVTLGGVEAKNAEYLNVNGSAGITFQLDDVRTVSAYTIATGNVVDLNYNAATNKLTITRNGGGNITDAQAQAIVRGLAYYNVLDNVASNTRTVEIVAKNALAEVSTAVTSTITIVETNDAPTVGAIYVDKNGNNQYDIGEASTGYYNSNISPGSSISQVIHQRYVDIPAAANPADMVLTISLARIDNSFNIKINGVPIIQVSRSQIETNSGGDYNAGTDYILSVDANGDGIGDGTAFFNSPWNANTNTNTPRLVITIKEGSITFEGTQNAADTWASRKTFALPTGSLVLPDLVNGRNVIEMYNLDDPGGDLVFGKIEAKLDPANSFARPSGVAISPINMSPIFSDPDGDPLSFTATGLPPGLTISAAGIISGTPTTPGTYTAVVTATDSNSAPISSNVLFNITNSNVAPIASNDTVFVNEDSSLNFNPKVNDNDPNGDVLTITQINGAAIAAGSTVALAGGHTVKLELDGTLTVTPAAGQSTGDVLFTYTVRDPGGLTSTANAKVTIQAVDDAPVNTMPATAWTTAQNSTGVSLTGLSIADVDAASGAMTVTLSVTSGSLTATAGGGVTVTGSGTGSMVLTGTLSALNAYLAGASVPQFVPTTGFDGTVTLTMLTNDQGNTGSGGPLTDSDTQSIIVTGVNDAPVNTLPVTGWNVAEDAASLTLTGLSIVDIDAASGNMTVTLSVDAGSLLASAGGGVTVSGSGTGSIVLTGTLANLNAYLGGAFAPQFVPSANFNGSVTLSMTTNDLGNTGAGGALSDTDTRTITVTAVNDAPTLLATIPDQTVLEDQAVNYVVPVGTFGDIDSSLTWSATLADGSALPAWLTFNTTTRTFTGTPPANFNGVLDIRVIAGDGQFTASDTFLLTVQSVNDAPEGTDKTISLAEDGTYTFTAADFGFTDPNDTPANTFHQLVIKSLPANGTLRLSGTAVANGDIIAVADLANLTWTPTLNTSGTALANFTFSVRDDGGTANGGFNSDTPANRITFDVSAVNDAPVVTAPVTLGGTEDTSLVLSGISFTDVDVGSGGVSVTFTLPAGHALNWTATAFIGATGSGTNTITLTGQRTAINNAMLAGKLSVMPATDFVGTIVLSTQINDNGNTGSGGALTGSGSTNLVFAAVNDAPVLALPLADQSTLEDQSVAFTLPAGSFTDVDSSLTLTATLNGGGALPSWLVFNPATREFTGTPPANFTGVLDIRVSASDGEYSASDTFLLTVQAVNDAPAGTDKTITLNEDATYTFTAADFGFSDTSDTPANALTFVRIDTLPANGSLMLSGMAVSAGQSIAVANLASLTWTPATNANGAGLAGFTFSVQDDGGTANGGQDTDGTPNSITFNVTAVNDVPVAPVVAAQTHVDGQTVSINAAFTDVDNATLTYSAANLPAGLSINTVTGVISGALASSASQGGTGGVYSVTVTANDGAGGVTNTTFTWTVTNPAPVAANDSFTTNEDVPFTASLIANDSDPDGDTFSIITTPLTLPTRGSVVINADGTFTYTPTLNANGSDTFTYEIRDADGATRSATVTITITAVNDAPLSAPLTARSGIDGAAVSVNLGSTFSDVEGNMLTYTITGLPTGLTYDTATGVVSGTIDNSASQGGAGGVYTVQVQVSDGQGGTTTRSFDWSISNPAPDARNDAISAGPNTSTSGSLFVSNGSGADSDPDGDTIVVGEVAGLGSNVGVPVVGSNGGTFTINSDGSYTFNPGTDFIDVPLNQTRTTTITYTLSDGEGGFDTATVTVTVTGVNEVPTVSAIGNQISLDSDAVVFNVAPFFNDADNDTLTFSAPVLPDGLSINAAGVISGTIAKSASQTNGGVYTVVVTADDNNGGIITQTFTWTVTNPTPTAVNDTATTNEDTAVTIDVRANDTDPDLDPLVIVATGPNAPVAGNGTVSIVAGSLLYTPNANFNGTDTIVYTISDGNGGFSTASILVTVTAVNDAPVSVAVPDQRNNVGNVVSLNVGSFFSDVDSNDVASTEDLDFAVTSPQSVTGLPTGLSFDPETGVISGTVDPSATTSSPYTITITATDASGATVSRVFVWQIYNDVPIAVDDAVTTSEDTAVTFNALDGTASGGLPDVDPEAFPLTVISATAANGTVVFNSTTGEMTYTPNLNFNGVDTIVYTVQDNGGNQATASVTVTVTPVNDAPTGPATLSNVANSDSDTVAISLGAFFDDVDLDDVPNVENLVFSATNLPAGLSINPATGEITGKIAAGASGVTGDRTYAVTITVQDRNGGAGTLSVSRSFDWQVTNPAPSADDEAVTINEDTVAVIPVLVGDTDPDGDTLVVDQATAGNGTVVINANGTLNYTPNPHFNGTDTIVYRISDGNGGYATASVTITVTPVNDAPTSLAISNQTAEDSSSVSFAAGSFFTDVDLNDTAPDTVIYSATGLPRGLSIDPTTGLITGSLASDVSQDQPGGVHSVTITLTDLAGAFSSRTLTWTVTNPVPVALADSASGNEDTAISGTLANDSDPDGDTLTFQTSPVVAPLNGTVVINSNGTYTYTPAANFNGTDTFTYRVSDGQGGFATAVATITVLAVNDAPVAVSDTSTTNEDQLVNIAVLGGDSDVDGDTLTVTSAAAPNGTVTIKPDGTVDYVPNANFSGTDTITYTISDGKGGTATSTVTVTVAAVNDLPVANNDTASTLEDTSVDITVLGNDTDLDGDTLTVTSASATNGTVVIGAGGVLTFTPDLNYHGPATINYTISDGKGGTASASVAITVVAVNDAPVATSPAVTTAEDTSVNGVITVSDVDGGAPVFTVLTAPAHGTVVVNVDGTYTYTPAANYNGSDSFAVTVSDGNGGTTTVTIPLTVTAVNDAPVVAVAAPDRTSPEDQPFSFTVPLTNFSDVDGPALVLTATLADGSALPSWVIFDAATGAFSGTPPQDFNGAIDIRVTGSDGTLSASDTFRLTISPVNDAPVAVDAAIATAEDTVLNGTLPVATDVDGNALVYSAGTSAPTHGSVIINADGTYTYTPDANYNGPDSFTYTVSDGTVLIEKTITVTVSPVNDAPVATADSATTLEDTSVNIAVRANDTDIDGNALSISEINGVPVVVNTPVAVTGGSVVLNADGTLTFTPTVNFNGAPSFTYTVSDGQGSSATATVNLTVTAVNDAPVLAIAIPDVSFAEDQAVAFAIPAGTFTDIDGPALTYTATLADGSPLPSWLVFNPLTQGFAGTPPQDYNGVVDIRVTASDGTLVASDVFRLAITPVNDAPVVSNHAFTTAEDAVFSGSLPTATDVDGDGLTYGAGNTAPSHGSVTINANGTFSYTPNADYHGSDTFTYVVSDGTVSVERTVTVTVTPVNDLPVAANDFNSTDPLDTVSGTVLANDADIKDGDLLTVTSVDGTVLSGGSVTVAGASGGLLTIAPDGTYTFDPNGDFNALPPGVYASSTFSYTISDGNGGTATASLTITVPGVNDPPTAVADIVTTAEDTPLTFDPRGNDTDPELNPLLITHINDQQISVGAPVTLTAGTIRLETDGRITFIPSSNFNGPVNLTYTVFDQVDGYATGSIRINVTPVNDAPMVVTPLADQIALEDGLVSFALPANTFADVDSASLNVTATLADGSPLPTWLVFNPATRLFEGTPPQDYAGVLDIMVAASDGNQTVSDAFQLTIASVNDAPVGSDISLITSEDTPYTFTGTEFSLTDARDNPANALQAVVIDTLPAAGVLTLNGVAVSAGQTIAVSDLASLIWTPPLNASGNALATFTFRMQDNGGVANGGADTDSIAKTVTLSVTPVNDAPTASSQALITAEDAPVTGVVTASDLDGDALSYVLDSSPSHGTVTVNADGTYRYVPDGNFNGTDSFTVRVADGKGGFALVTIPVTVTPVNDMPTATSPALVTAEDMPVTGAVTGADLDGDALSFTLDVAPAHGTVTVGADGTYRYVPDGNFNGADSFTVRVADGKGGFTLVTIPVTVTPVNDAPTASSPVVSTAEDTPLIGVVSGTDLDGDTLSYVLDSIPSHGTVTVSADGTYRYVPDANFNGADSFTVRVADGNGGFVLVTVAVTVTPVNDAPVARPDSAETVYNTAVTVNVLGNDSDIDGAALRVTAATSGQGSVTLNPDGTLTFVPLTGFSGEALVTYTVSDGNGGFATGTVRILVGPAPVVTSPSPSVDKLDVNAPVVSNDRNNVDLSFKTIAASGIILETVNTISNINGSFVPLDTPHPLLTAVNGMSPLSGGVELGRGGRIVDPGVVGLVPGYGANGITGNAGFGSGTDFNGFSAIESAVRYGERGFDLSSNHHLDLGLVVREGGIQFNVRERGVVTGDVCRNWLEARQSNDQPLPEWLQHITEGEFRGTPPAGLEKLELKLIVRLEDGSTEVRLVSLDLRTGIITPIEPKTEPSPQAALFSAQITAALSATQPVIGETDILKSLL
ncbi:MAG: Ig-like domain-containing protein [Beijerinckiaceae bacterium]